jgi:hypothetical protein
MANMRTGFKSCSKCENFKPDAKDPLWQAGFCDYHKDFFMPSSLCKHYQRIDAEKFPRKEDFE